MTDMIALEAFIWAWLCAQYKPESALLAAWTEFNPLSLSETKAQQTSKGQHSLPAKVIMLAMLLQIVILQATGSMLLRSNLPVVCDVGIFKECKWTSTKLSKKYGIQAKIIQMQILNVVISNWYYLDLKVS